MDFQIVAQVRALGEQNKVRKRERSSHNLIRLLLLNTELVLRIPITVVREAKCPLHENVREGPTFLNFHRLGSKQRHVPAYLLEVQRGHRDVRRKLCLGQLNVRFVTVQQIELVPSHLLLLPVL